jgi:hypothetical protein
MAIINKDDNKITQEDVQVTDERLIKAAQETTIEIPSAYIPIKLSTKGKLGAPEVFHIKNFTTEDLLALGLSEQEELPAKVCKLLDELIFEKEVSVKNFHEQEVIELLVTLYKEFYSTLLKDLDWQVTQEDRDWLLNFYGGDIENEEYRKAIRSLDNGTWKPKFEIDLTTLKTYELPEDFKTTVLVKKANGFSCKYSWSRFGDVVVLKDFVDKIYKNEDKKFASLSETIKFREQSKERFLKGENIAIQSLPNVPKEELEKVKEYEIDKVKFATLGAKAMHLVEYKGTDVSTWPLEKKIEIAKDPDLDYNTLKQITDYFSTMKIGFNEEIVVRNPIQNMKVMKRRYSFRLNDILQSVQRGDSDTTTIEFV